MIVMRKTRERQDWRGKLIETKSLLQLDLIIYSILLLAGATAIKECPEFPTLGVFIMLSVVVVAAVVGMNENEAE